MKTYFLTALLLVVSSFITAQNTTPDFNHYTKSVQLIKGLPPDEFYDKFRKDIDKYSFSTFASEELQIDLTFLVTHNNKRNHRYYLIYAEDAETIKTVELFDSSNSSTKQFSIDEIEQNEFTYSLQIKQTNENEVIFQLNRIERTVTNIEFTSGFRAELVFINSHYIEDIYSSDRSRKHNDYNKFTTNYSISYELIWKFGDNNAILLCPTAAVYESPFHGIELGVSYRRYFTPSFYSYVGTTYHLGLEAAHGAFNFHDGDGGFILDFGIGYGITEELAFLIGFHSVKNVHARDIIHTSAYGENNIHSDTVTYKNWNWLLSFGIEFNY